MEGKIILVLIAVLTSAILANAQIEIYNDNTNNIKSFCHFLMISPVSASNTNRISITDNHNNDVHFSTNLPASFGIDCKRETLEYKLVWHCHKPKRGNSLKNRSMKLKLLKDLLCKTKQVLTNANTRSQYI